MSPHNSFAQCNCLGKDSMTQRVIIDTSNAPKVAITFNKYNDPTNKMGLTCISIQDTVTVVSSTSVRNKSTGAITGANFTVQVSAKITGPAISGGGGSNILPYGPYDFGPYGTTGIPSDSILLGPDTILNKKAVNATPSNPAPYMGTGTVSDTLTFGGGALSDAGTSFDYSIRTKYWGTALITFYLCPLVPLASSIRDFTGARSGDYIQLQWLSDNQQNNTTYEIQISSNGQSFADLGNAAGDSAATGTTAKYQYQYYLNQANVGKLYFRIKETGPGGQVSYSQVLVVSPGEGTGAGAPVSYQAYPNPATNTLVFQFNTNQSGRYLLELINTAGQVIQQKPVTLTGTNQIRLDLNPKPVKGLYFLRTSDLTHNASYVSKVFIN